MRARSSTVVPVSPLIVVVALAAGGSGCSSGGGTRYPDAVGRDRDAATDGDAGAGEVTPSVDAGPDAPIYEPADPTLTRLLVPGPATLVGWGTSSCTNGIPARADTWCAFSRKPEGSDGVELWVFDFTAAVAAGPPACDGTSSRCLRLTTALWTGTSIEGPSHPGTHRFDGDTLIFHAGAASDTVEPYRGPVWAWRPGWTEAHQLTSAEGLSCVGERRAPVLHCHDAVVIEPTGSFLPAFRIRGFELRAGRLGDAPPVGLLPLVERVAATGPGDLIWQAAFTPHGERFVYSSATAGTSTPVVKWLDVEGAPGATPVVLAEDAADWRISHDGARLYHRQGVDLDGFLAPGRLATVELPPATGTRVLADDVVRYRLVGAHDEVVSDVDHGVLFEQDDGSGDTSWFLLTDPGRPAARVAFPGGAFGVDVSIDLRHSLYYEDGPNGQPHIKILRNDGSGSCSPKRDTRSETYGGHFSHTSRLVFWIEYGGDSEEGWYALPETCGDARKFGDYVTWYFPVGDDFVVFRGTDHEDSAYHLQYVSLGAGLAGPRALPKMIEKDVDDAVAVLARGTEVNVVYALSRIDAPLRGIFAHGPLPR